MIIIFSVWFFFWALVRSLGTCPDVLRNEINRYIINHLNLWPRWHLFYDAATATAAAVATAPVFKYAEPNPELLEIRRAETGSCHGQ